MQNTTHQSEAFVRIANQHAAELRVLSGAFDKAVAQHGAQALTQNLVEAVKTN
ncbi:MULTISPECIES: hypothetical protein [unclassified Comamonas]|uniref:hypothetical protein n=1 Tax=unclassified Comamonas TaxID=2638500 RepID=UPI000AD93D13|nr:MULTISPECIES: hypothetical protein [unclassified Comamonas]UUC92451.1 hypothetical protein NOX35_19505 [Comamonas sp. C11]UUC92503.1 hypothetical protein NOX35_19775 [Comamonas sp. C11]